MGKTIKDTLFSLCEQTFLGAILLVIVLFCLLLNINTTGNQQFVYLADSFLHGRLYFQETPGSYLDVIWHEGKAYWHLGPLPALLLTPFVLFTGTNFLQGYLHFPLTVLNFYFLYAIALRLGIKRKIDALWLSFAYIFGMIYFTVAINSNSWRFAHVVATAFILLSLFEYFGLKRYWLIGSFIGLAVATRLDLILILSFFLLGILYEGKTWKNRIIFTAQLLAPVFFAGVLLLWYNYARFGDIWQTGYALNSYTNNLFGFGSQMWIAFQYSGGKIFSLLYLPTNLYYYLLKAPHAVLLNEESHILVWPFMMLDNFRATGILIAAPLFLFALKANIKEKIVKQSWLAAILIFGLLLLHYVPNQRYLLDVTPFLFLLLVRALAPGISFPVKTLIVVGFVMNVMFYFYLFSASPQTFIGIPYEEYRSLHYNSAL